MNKKVLLRERMRHTDRGVSSTPSVTQGGVPPGRVPLARSDGGVPKGGVPPGRVPCWPGLIGGGGVPEVGYPPAGSPWPGLMGGGPEVRYPHGQV